MKQLYCGGESVKGEGDERRGGVGVCLLVSGVVTWNGCVFTGEWCGECQ